MPGRFFKDKLLHRRFSGECKDGPLNDGCHISHLGQRHVGASNLFNLLTVCFRFFF